MSYQDLISSQPEAPPAPFGAGAVARKRRFDRLWKGETARLSQEQKLERAGITWKELEMAGRLFGPIEPCPHVAVRTSSSLCERKVLTNGHDDPRGWRAVKAGRRPKLPEVDDRPLVRARLLDLLGHLGHYRKVLATDRYYEYRQNAVCHDLLLEAYPDTDPVWLMSQAWTNTFVVDIDCHHPRELATAGIRLKLVLEALRCLFPRLVPLVFRSSALRAGYHVVGFSECDITVSKLHALLVPPLAQALQEMPAVHRRHAIAYAGCADVQVLRCAAVELFPMVGKVIRVPLGPGSPLLAHDGSTVLASTFREFLDLDRTTRLSAGATAYSFEQYLLPEPSDAKDRPETGPHRVTPGAVGQRPPVAAPPRQPVAASTPQQNAIWAATHKSIVEGRELWRDGLSHPGQRDEAVRRMIRFYFHTGIVTGEELTAAVFDWLAEKHNGFSNRFLRDPEQIRHDVRRQVGKHLTWVAKDKVTPWALHIGTAANPAMQHITAVDIERILDIVHESSEGIRSTTLQKRIVVISRLLEHIKTHGRSSKKGLIVRLSRKVWSSLGAQTNGKGLDYRQLRDLLVDADVLFPLPALGSRKGFSKVCWEFDDGDPVNIADHLGLVEKPRRDMSAQRKACRQAKERKVERALFK